MADRQEGGRSGLPSWGRNGRSASSSAIFPVPETFLLANNGCALMSPGPDVPPCICPLAWGGLHRRQGRWRRWPKAPPVQVNPAQSPLVPRFPSNPGPARGKLSPCQIPEPSRLQEFTTGRVGIRPQSATMFGAATVFEGMVYPPFEVTGWRPPGPGNRVERQKKPALCALRPTPLCAEVVTRARRPEIGPRAWVGWQGNWLTGCARILPRTRGPLLIQPKWPPVMSGPGGQRIALSP